MFSINDNYDFVTCMTPRLAMSRKQMLGHRIGTMPVHCILPFIQNCDIESMSF